MVIYFKAKPLSKWNDMNILIISSDNEAVTINCSKFGKNCIEYKSQMIEIYGRNDRNEW